MNRYLFLILSLLLLATTQGVTQNYHTANISVNQPPCNNTSILSINTYPLDIKLYPNPGTDVISIELPGYYSTCTLILSDLLGKKIKTIKLTSQRSFELITSDINEGLYFISVLSDSFSYTKRIAIIH